MNVELKGSFEISRYNIKFYFNPDQRYLLHLELRAQVYENSWKHPMFKNHILKEFDFKNKGKKEAVVEAINQFLIWFETQKK